MHAPAPPVWLSAGAPPLTAGVAHLAYFRNHFIIQGPVSDPTPIRLTADSRYRLTVNETLIAAGPAKPSAGEFFVDTVDLGPYLRTGSNVIGIELLSWVDGGDGNLSVLRTGSAALAVAGTLPDGTDLADHRSWRCAQVTGRTFEQGVNTVYLGTQEQIDNRQVPHGWLVPGFDDSTWAVPTPDLDDPLLGAALRPRLRERPIPALTLDPIRFRSSATRRGSDDTPGCPPWNAFIGGDDVVQIPGNHLVTVDLDAGELVTAYLALQVVGGAGATVELTAAECYEYEPVEIPWLRRKGDRTDAVNGDLYGDADVYRLAGVGTGPVPEMCAPFWFRTFRYLRLTITTADEPLQLVGLDVTRTHYPLDIQGRFRSSAATDSQLWDTSVRTLLNCMHETFEDCPFYEQLQYAMDTRSQALFSLHLSTDDRLVRRAIEDFASSGDPSGLTESRVPCVRPQVIPGFSLFWIFMVADHLQFTGDRAFTGRFLGRIDAVLSYFDRSLSADGLVVSPLEDSYLWNFVDWTHEWGPARGVPQLGHSRENTIITFMYITALRSAASIASHCRRPGLAEEYLHRATALSTQVAKGPAWDAAAGYFRDTDTGAPSSQHAQVWAVLSGTVTGAEATRLLRRALTDPMLATCSYAMSLSLFDALRLARLDDLISWQPWHDMLAQNLTTWAEDTVSNRSDCHAWGSVALQQFPRYVLGVRPTMPGFDAVLIDPAPSELRFAEGTVPTPHGPVHVHWERVDARTRHVRVQIPARIELTLGHGARLVSDQLVGDTRHLLLRQP